jgi:hypothetical protein
MGMASIINGEPPTFRYSDVTAVLVNDQNTIFMVKIMVWQKVRHIHSIIPQPPHFHDHSHAKLCHDYSSISSPP